MPVYLVRWPKTLSVSIVRATNREQLTRILDEIGDPSGCKVKQYDGPLFLDLELDVEYERWQEDEQPIRYWVKDVSNCIASPEFRFYEWAGDTVLETKDEIIRFAFPHYAKYVDEILDLLLTTNLSSEEWNEAREKCKQALLKDLEE